MNETILQVFNAVHQNDDEISDLNSEIFNLQKKLEKLSDQLRLLTTFKNAQSLALLKIIPTKSIKKIIMDSESSNDAGYGAQNQYFAKYITKDNKTIDGHSYGLSRSSCENAQTDVLKQMTKDQLEDLLE